jgi:small ligand-binding sensory domain FIST
MFGAALSEHPVAAHATGEVVGAVLEQVGERPDIATLFVTTPHVGTFEDIARAVRDTLHPRALIGATAVSVVGGPREVEEQPAVALWAGADPAGGLDTSRAVWFAAVPLTHDDWVFQGPDDAELDEASTLVLLADPASFPVGPFLDHLRGAHPHLQVVGGVASAGFGPDANRLTVDGTTRSVGAAGLLLPRAPGFATVVSQGCRPIGDPLTVTRAERNVVYEIAGRPALDRLTELLESLDEEDLTMARQGLHVGRVIDEHKAEFGRGDFLIRNVIGGDREVGALAVGDEIGIGDTVQFQVRDRRSADEDLRLLLDGHTADGALLFTCNGRGARLFGTPDHDARVVVQSIESTAVAGMFCAGEIGPVGDRTFLHGFTASVVLFGRSGGPDGRE